MTDSALTALASVALIWTVAVLTPGPNSVLLAHTAMSQGRGIAARLIGGLLVAMVVWVLFGMFGLTALVTAVPFVLIGLKLVGGAYLMFLGLRLLWISRRAPRHHATIQSPDQVGAYASAGPLARPFRIGFITNISNPKTAAFIASVFLAAMPPEPDLWLGVGAMAIVIGLSAAWYAIMLVVFSHRRIAHGYHRFRVWIDRLAGTVFVVFGARLATTD